MASILKSSALSFFALAALAGTRPVQSPTPPPTLNLMPVPKSLQLRPGRLRLDTTFTVAIEGFRDARLERAVARMLERLARRTKLTLPVEATGDAKTARLVVAAKGPGQKIQTVTEDESYTLDVDSVHAILRAPTVVGILRGLETWLQLVDQDGTGYFVPATAIADAPRFPWRGLLVDVGRHFEPVKVIERTLDGMAAVKLNVLHWHLSEDQGFRVESTRYPRLQWFGSDGHYYTQAEIREVVAYARALGIRVVPEFDMPGHTSSWLVGYPELGSGSGPYRIQRTWGVFDPTFDPTRTEVYRFIDGFVKEMAALFPDPYWHIGGDEVNGKEWDANPRIQAWMRKHDITDNAALQAYFNQRLSRILAAHGKHMVGWDEILHPDLPKTAVVQSWRGTEYLGEAVRAGYQAILSAPYYLDHMESAEDMYVDPAPDSLGLTAEEAARVLGGEACMWGEYVVPRTLDSRVWPRLAAIAEKLWSPASVRDVHDMYRRLAVRSVRLEELGLEHNVTTSRLLHLAIGNSDADLQTLFALLRVSQPVTNRQRTHLQRGMTQKTSLMDLVDAPVPDPPARWNSLTLVERFLADSGRTPALQDSLRADFARWQALAPKVHAIAQRRAVVQEAVPAADALARVGRVGLAALDRLAGSVPATPAWQKQARAALDSSTGPQGLLRLVVVDVARWLVEVAPVNVNGSAAPATPRVPG